MYQIDFNKPETIHFIGIGGISMSGLAQILLEEGFRVSGSDAHKTQLTEHLEQMGAKIAYGQQLSERGQYRRDPREDHHHFHADGYPVSGRD